MRTDIVTDLHSLGTWAVQHLIAIGLFIVVVGLAGILVYAWTR